MNSKARPRLVGGGDEGVLTELNDLFAWAEVALLCVSYASYQAFRLLDSSIYDFLRRGGALRALFDIERFFTDPEIIAELCTIPGDSECRVYYRTPASKHVRNQYGPLHAKIYLFKKKTAVRALIGSSNFTVGGLKSNVESNALLEGSVQEPFFKEIMQTFDGLWDSPHAIRPEDRYEIIERYEAFIQEDRKSRLRLRRQRKSREKILGELFKAAREQIQEVVNTDVAYLMGLISGGGYFVDDNTIRIKYHKGVFNKGTKDEGYIYSPGISDLRMKQSVAFRNDVVGICERLTRFFKRTGSKDKASYKKRTDYDYDIHVHLDPNSKHFGSIREFLSRCDIVRRRVIPVFPSYLPQFDNKSILASFIRGYADVRARIRPTDREGTEGPLRIALSFSKDTDKFASEIQKVLEKEFLVQRINLLPGSIRGRETMLRIDPVEIHKLGPQKFFSINWKQLLLADYSSYNREKFPQRYE